MLVSSKRGARTRRDAIERLSAQRHDTATTSANRQALIERVARYERKYGMSSEQAHGAIDRGELRETQEICSWLIAHETLKRSQVA
jgi:predicted nucleic acid-binding protein